MEPTASLDLRTTLGQMYDQTRHGRSQRFQSIWRRSVRTKVARDNLLQAVPQHRVLVLHAQHPQILQHHAGRHCGQTCQQHRTTPTPPPSPYAIAPLPTLQKQQTFISANLSDASKLAVCMPGSGQTATVHNQVTRLAILELDSQAPDTESLTEKNQGNIYRGQSESEFEESFKK